MKTQKDKNKALMIQIAINDAKAKQDLNMVQVLMKTANQFGWAVAYVNGKYVLVG